MLECGDSRNHAGKVHQHSSGNRVVRSFSYLTNPTRCVVYPHVHSRREKSLVADTQMSGILYFLLSCRILVCAYFTRNKRN